MFANKVEIVQFLEEAKNTPKVRDTPREKKKQK